MEYKEYKHNPPHLFAENTKYFITGSTYKNQKILKNGLIKENLLEYILIYTGKLKMKLEDWVILDNHYHLMMDVFENPKDISKLFNNVHKFSAIWIKKNEVNLKNLPKIWYNYWDTCITFEKSYFARLNYIWFNPVKHGYVYRPEDWKYGSYYERYKKEKEYLLRVNKDFPSDKVKIRDDF